MALHLVPRGLHYVEAVAEHGSIQGASRAIGIAASAIDRQIKLLEDRLGVPLFDRTSTGMTLSPVGEMFIVLTRRWKADENRIWSDVKQMQGVDLGHIRLVTMDSLVNSVLPCFLHHVAEIYPKVRIDVVIGTPDDAIAALDAGNADVALAFNVRAQRDLHLLWVEELPLLYVAAPGHALAREKEVRLSQVRDHPIVVQSPSLAIRRILEARHGWVFSGDRPPIVTNSLQLLKQMVMSGSHAALTSELDVAQELLDGRIVAIPVTGQNVAPQNITLAISAKRTLPRIATRVADLLAGDIAALLERVRAHPTG
ncbi:MAG: LysR family transcriptional regulator [Desulfomicrobium sp.]|uniref:LysR family transcriptional regulator n=1 Tax=Hoeflea sp. TaxID=1940281 RepID=UPI0025C6E4F5|nr:LysR family transcriptional regulator [Hoeflea sp.]MBU4527143.1 LysR family transcriptional regulator [Alphaproteobacteria bacterium]MBV1713913.1 LysR family transcriptional regulator [Desulfomicrobium sp.]MBU4544125.1 LysR family transcriptional regulator [Alphaproteobacteria bacterium]MBU4552325.1 LysR family transcriptional regulator [Alphaproteobacteria bacterium]MBV1786214.1 LysR family transcriptional regulator [Hoeflea sp.]